MIRHRERPLGRVAGTLKCRVRPARGIAAGETIAA